MGDARGALHATAPRTRRRAAVPRRGRRFVRLVRRPRPSSRSSRSWRGKPSRATASCASTRAPWAAAWTCARRCPSTACALSPPRVRHGRVGRGGNAIRGRARVRRRHGGTIARPGDLRGEDGGVVGVATAPWEAAAGGGVGAEEKERRRRRCSSPPPRRAWWRTGPRVVSRPVVRPRAASL